MRKRATIRDVAALAGASLKTVSRVINREPGVSPELAARVEHAVAQLGYRHNMAASNLRRGVRTSSIGVLLHDLSNEFSATLLRAVEDATRPRGIAVFSASLDNEAARESALATDMVSRRVDGLVLMPTSSDQSYLLSDLLAGLAVVAVDRPVSGADVDTVVVDNAGGASTATRHLAERGHERIALLTDRITLWTAAERHRGYVAGLKAGRLPYEPTLVVTDVSSSAQAAEEVHRLMRLPDPPTAIFAARNNLAVGTVRALQELGRSQTVALVGFDDFPLADLVQPAVTVVSQDVAAAGASAAQLLLERMDGGAASPRRVVLPTTLVERGSGEIAPV
ncbi:MAG: LacI family DNA-binding transcriptional regulator [Actinomycetales bacterium]